MKRPQKNLGVIVMSLLISILHLPFAFAKPNLVKKTTFLPNSSINDTTGSKNTVVSGKSVYDSLQLDLSGLSRQAFDNARKGWEKLRSQGKLPNESVIAIVDFTQPSTKKRLFVLDMNNYKVLFNTLVAHGRKSGREWATNFSNRLSSNKSSPGFYITGQTYTGSNGYSLKLIGIESGINDKAVQRAIVMHGANYVNESYIISQGYIGRSQGCPAVPARYAKNIIDALKNGACLYIHVPDQRYLSRSAMLNGNAGA